MNAGVQFIVSNAVSVVIFLLLLVEIVQSQRKSALAFKGVSMALLIVTYFLTSCWSAVVTTFFSLMLCVYEVWVESRSRTPRRAVELALTLTSALLAAIAQVAAGGLTLFSAIPVISALISGFGTFLSTNRRHLRIKSGITSLLWVAFDVKNLLFGCVVTDLVLIGSMFATLYLDKFDPDDGYWLQRRIYIGR